MARRMKCPPPLLVQIDKHIQQQLCMNIVVAISNNSRISSKISKISKISKTSNEVSRWFHRNSRVRRVRVPPLTAIISPQAAGATVTFSINGVPLSQVPTNTAGQASTSIILPASNTNVIASSPGYGTAAATISVTGTAPPTTQTTPEPVEIIIYSG